MSPTVSTEVNPRGTRTRILESAASLFSRQGYSGTGVKAVLADAGAPYGSLYHFFPGGKQELGIAALAHNGEHGRARIESEFPPGRDAIEATLAGFATAASRLEESGFSSACPIATIALEVAGTDEPMRAAASDAFESWVELLEARYSAAGMTAERAHETAVTSFCLMEGAFLLALTTRTAAPLHIAGRSAADAVAAGLADSRKALQAAQQN